MIYVKKGKIKIVGNQDVVMAEATMMILSLSKALKKDVGEVGVEIMNAAISINE